MIEFSGLNFLAILVAWIITIIVGAWWYSPAGFGKLWSKLSDVDMMKTPKNETNRAIIFVVVSCLLQTFALALILNSLNVQTLGEGVIATLIIWFGFTALTTIGNNLYQRLSLKFWALNAAYFFVIMLINGAILTIWN